MQSWMLSFPLKKPCWLRDDLKDHEEALHAGQATFSLVAMRTNNAKTSMHEQGGIDGSL
jgi:hypothetical protein